MESSRSSLGGALGESFAISAVEQLDEVNQKDGWSTIEYRQLEPGPLDARFAVREGSCGVHALERHNRRFEVHCSPPPGLVAVFAVKGGEASANGRAIGRDDLVVLMPGAELHGIVTAGLEVCTLLTPTADLDEVLRHLSPRSMPLSGGGAQVIRAAAPAMRAFRRAHREFVIAASHRGTADEEESAEILTGVARAISANDPTPEPHLSRPRALRAVFRAREYIEAHLQQPIKISAVCEYAGVDLRSLERYFARELGVTPKRYLLSRRLNAARRRLLAADPERDRVTDVAFEHGLTHLGRFPALYRGYFGEYPRETLRSTRNRDSRSSLSGSG